MNSVETVLLENIDNPKSLFIFPTDIAVSQWADHLLRLRGGTVAMNKFIAWDKLKQNSIRSKVQNKRSIPSALRKIFVCRLIRENAEACAQGRPPVFSSLIGPQWARQAAQFTGWLTDILPQLGSWLRKTTGLAPSMIPGAEAGGRTEKYEADDRDLFVLAKRYAQFLDANGLFEPAWETPPFEDDGKECFIFFPQALSDYSDYRDLLSESGHVKTVSADAENMLPETWFYTNSRSEITEAALYIRALHENEGVNWEAIAVCIADEQDYEPYVLREFTVRNIPFVKRIGKPLSDYAAGQFFRSIADCISRDFAFPVVTGLLLNSNLPWKDTPEIKKLVDFGIKNNCVSSWVEPENGKDRPVNVWEDAFAMPFGGFDPAVRQFFTDFKKRVKDFRGAGSFAELRRQYFIFRERFFDMNNCTDETDLILSRCISELTYLCELEKDFPEVQPPDSFMFFTEYLGEVIYLARQSASGVAILPYKTAAAAPFDCHIILGASQENLSLLFSGFKFLPKSKRELLGFTDEDASSVFINLHKYNSKKPAAFFCSEQTFSGYAIPHSMLDAPSKPVLRYAQETAFEGRFCEDLFSAENNCFSSINSGKEAGLIKLYANQSMGFDSWRSRREGHADCGGMWRADENLLNIIREQFAANPEFPGKYSVSASSLEVYYRCSLEWLFQRVLNLENVEIEAGMMTENITGVVFHAALNMFFSELIKNDDVLERPKYGGAENTPYLPESYRKLLRRCLDTLFDGFPRLPPDGKPQMSALTMRLLAAEKNHFQHKLEKCIAVFLSFFHGCRVKGSENLYYSQRDSYFLRGTLDCILEDARENSETKGGLIIIDFKLKNTPSRTDCIGGEKTGLANFQLPVYMSLAEEAEKNDVHTALFFSILELKPVVIFGTVKNSITNAVTPNIKASRILRNSERFMDIMEEFGRKAERFAEEIKSGNFSVFESEFSGCSNCNYQRVCRTVYKIGSEKGIVSLGSSNGK
ncbi:MAG: PD-(D/E)XK nuclease family protein [Treponema sp.]|nr:PD-(D/E)XK nuclease family protein [Treponema sp.]